MTIFITILIFIFLIGILVLAHELGHYILAKKSGIQVFEFGIGFPPKLWSFKHKGTVYSLNLIPLGGFVRMKEYAHDEGNVAESFEEKNFVQKFFVVSAGILMNIVFAWVVFSSLFLVGFPMQLGENLSDATIKNPHIAINSVLPESPALKYGILAGDTILSFNGEPVKDISTFIEMVRKNTNTPIILQLQKGTQIREVRVIPEKLESLGEYGIGVSLVLVGKVSYEAPLALQKGAELTFSSLYDIFRGFGMLIERVINQKPVGMEVAGPIGIALLTREVAKLGWAHLLQFAALLSLNLAVINFLPLPALDGGRALFLIIERVRRKAMNQKVESLIHQIGFSLLLLLIVFITFRDLARIDFLSKIFS